MGGVVATGLWSGGYDGAMSDEPSAPQIENEKLNIHDKDRDSAGGPPGWVAMAIVGGLFLVTAAIFVVVGIFVFG